MLLGVTNKKQVLIDLGIDDIWEADADDNIAGGKTWDPSISVTVTCHILSQYYVPDKYGQISIGFEGRLD